MISFKQKGDFSKTISYLKKVRNPIPNSVLERYGKDGVAALSAATPKDTGLTADSWRYEIKRERTFVNLSFYNSNIQNGVPIAIIIQYGHATQNGVWIDGVDYINPAVKPIFEKLSNELWEEVKKV